MGVWIGLVTNTPQFYRRVLPLSTHQNLDPERLALTPEMCKAARALLRWTQKDLAAKSGISERTVAAFEAGQAVPFVKTVSALKSCFTDAGVEFVTGDLKAGVIIHWTAHPAASRAS